MEETHINILERVRASYYHLTTAERKVADYVLANAHNVQFMSITQLADECGAAEATISRFCRSLELKGFNAFKIELARHSASQDSQPEHPEDTFQGRCAQVGRLAQEAVRQSLALADQTQVLRAVEIFEKAGQVMCIGSGGSMIMASECAHLFAMATGKFFTITDSHQQLSAAATLGPGSAIVLFSYSGATTSGIQVLKQSRERGIPTVLITRFPKSPAASLAEVVLRCGSNEGPFQFGSVPARVAQLVVVDMLFQEYYHRNQAACDESIQQVAAALSEKHI